MAKMFMAIEIRYHMYDRVKEEHTKEMNPLLPPLFVTHSLYNF